MDWLLWEGKRDLKISLFLSPDTKPLYKYSLFGHNQKMVTERSNMEFIVEGEPQGKARPRFSRKSGTVYTPAKTAKYEKEIRQAYIAVGGKLIPEGSYAVVTVDAYFKIPKSYTKRKRLDCEQNINRPDKKPDIDNVLKVVLDALNKVAYEDDKQVIEVICRKWYSRSSGFLKVQIIEDKR